MKTLVIISFVFILLSPPVALSLTPPANTLTENKITDQELKDLAVEKLFIPYNADNAYYKSQKEQKNTMTIWVITNRQTKIDLIEKLKEIWLENEKVVIKLPASYYIDEINQAMYNSLKSDSWSDDFQRGLGVMFKAIALMDGDFDNGKSYIATLKAYFSDEWIQFFKDNYPDKYDKLIKLDKERGYSAK